MTLLRTPRLVLRRACPDDLEGLHAVFSDARAMLYWSRPPHEDMDATRAWLDSMISSPLELSDDFVITLDGAAIGKIGAYRLPDFGYILAPAHWGKGLASEAMAAFLPHVFERSGLDRITADTDPRNIRSIALLQKHGFVEAGRATGTWETHLGLCDSIYFALEKKDYQAVRPG